MSRVRDKSPRRKALVVGASRGIGRDVALRLASRGYDVGLLARDAAKLRSVADECRARGARAAVYAADVCDAAALAAGVKRCVAGIQEGNDLTAASPPLLHVLVYNAGVQMPCHSAFLCEPSTADGVSPLERMMSTNFTACVRTVSCCLPTLVSTGDGCTTADATGASIVIISSMARYAAAIPGMGAYFASKYALHGYAGALLEEVRHHNVRVSCVCPGVVNTDMGMDIIGGLARQARDGGAGADASLNAGTTAAQAAGAPTRDAGSRVKLDLRDIGDSAIDIPPERMVQPADVSDAVEYIVGCARTACPVEVTLAHTTPIVSLLDLIVEKPDAPQPAPRCLHPVTRPHAPVALITGASRGIGRSLALELAAQGCDVSLVARDAAQLRELARECEASHGVRAIIHPIDVSDTGALEAAVHRTVEVLGSLSHVVNNAAINRRKSALTAGRRVWDQVLDVNLRAALHLTRAALPYLQQARPRPLKELAKSGHSGPGSAAIVYENGLPGLSAYFATKHALSGFSSCLFEDVKHLDIKVTVLAPGLTNTDLGNRPGPMAMLSVDQKLQCADVAAALRYIVNTPPHVSPRRILLAPLAQSLPIYSAIADRALQLGSVALGAGLKPRSRL